MSTLRLAPAEAPGVVVNLTWWLRDAASILQMNGTERHALAVRQAADIIAAPPIPQAEVEALARVIFDSRASGKRHPECRHCDAFNCICLSEAVALSRAVIEHFGGKVEDGP